jgi:hypothetical protein
MPGHSDERDAAGIEDLDHLGEIRQRAREAIDLVDHDRIDQPLGDIGHKSLERRVFHGGAGEAAIIVDIGTIRSAPVRCAFAWNQILDVLNSIGNCFGPRAK